MLNLNRQISAIIEATELTRRDCARPRGVSKGLLGGDLRDGLVQGAWVATRALTLLRESCLQQESDQVNF